MAKSPNVFRKKSEVWCGRDIILMCGGFGGPPLGPPLVVLQDYLYILTGLYNTFSASVDLSCP